MQLDDSRAHFIARKNPARSRRRRARESAVHDHAIPIAAAGTARMKAPSRNQRKKILARRTTHFGMIAFSQGSPAPRSRKAPTAIATGMNTLRIPAGARRVEGDLLSAPGSICVMTCSFREGERRQRFWLASTFLPAVARSGSLTECRS
jgi:hypothetical protein